MGRWRVVEHANSIFGATGLGKSVMQYKGWAVPILRTSYTNTKAIIKDPQKIKEREGQELLRVGLVSGAFALVGLYMLDSDADDPLSILSRKMVREGMSLFAALGTDMWLGTPRTMVLLQKLNKVLDQLVTVEKYQSTKAGKYKEGDLKAPKTLKRIITPRVLTQFDSK